VLYNITSRKTEYTRTFNNDKKFEGELCVLKDITLIIELGSETLVS
jgi:hypothetical protein